MYRDYKNLTDVSSHRKILVWLKKKGKKLQSTFIEITKITAHFMNSLQVGVTNTSRDRKSIFKLIASCQYKSHNIKNKFMFIFTEETC